MKRRYFWGRKFTDCLNFFRFYKKLSTWLTIAKGLLQRSNCFATLHPLKWPSAQKRGVRRSVGKLGCCSRKQERKNSTNHKARELSIASIVRFRQTTIMDKSLGGNLHLWGFFFSIHTCPIPSLQGTLDVASISDDYFWTSSFYSLSNVWIE